MTVGIDSNVILRYVVRDDDASYALASAFLEELTPDDPGFITQVSMAEIYWVLSRSYRLDKQTCLEVVRGLIQTESLEFDDGEGVVRALALAEEGADFGDALIQGAMELFAIAETVSFDRAASRALGWRLLGT